MILRKIVFLTFFLHLSFLASSQNYKPVPDNLKKEIIDQILKSSKATNSLECKFVQKKNLSMLSETVVSDGIMYFKKLDNLRWQYNKPYPFVFILSGSKVCVKNDKRTDTFDTKSNKIFKEISEIMIGGVNGGLVLKNKKFGVQYFQDQTTVQVRLTPLSRELKGLFTLININFTKTDWLVKSIEMKENGGDNTMINFTERNVNKDIREGIFTIH